MTRRRAKIRRHGAAREGYRRYVLLTQGRTGSTMLGRMLANHRRIVDYSELFNCNYHPRTGNAGSPDETLRFWLSRVERAKTGKPPPMEGAGKLGAGEILDRMVWREDYPPHIEAVGVKLLPYQMRREGPFPHLRQRLMERLPGGRAIVMTRENALRLLVSRQVANRIRQWHVFDESQRLPRPRLRWTPAELASALDEIEAADRRLLSLASSAERVYRLSYEDFLASRRGHWQRLLEFLSVSQAPPPPLETLRTEIRPLAASIQNYRELKTAFAGTKWERCFDE